MATTIRSTAVRADGTPIAGVNVHVYPVLPGSPHPNRPHYPAVEPGSETELLLGGVAVTDAQGEWEMDVTPSTVLEPAGAVGYRVVQTPPGEPTGPGSFDRIVVVPESSASLWVVDLEELDPHGAVNLSALDRHAARTRNVHGIPNVDRLVTDDGSLIVGGLGRVKSLDPPILEHLDAATIGAISVSGAWDDSTAYDARVVVTHSDRVWVSSSQTTAGEEPGIAAVWVELPTVVDADLRASFASDELLGRDQAGDLTGIPVAHFQRNYAIDVRDHGALGDGTTDDAEAIQAAIDAVPDGGIVVLPAGDYLVNDPLVLTGQDVALIGVGARISRLVVGPLFPDDGTPVVRLGGGTGVVHGTRIEAVTIVCSGIAGPAIYSNEVQERGGVDNVIVRDYTNRGIVFEEAGGTHAANCAIRRTELWPHTTEGASIGILIDGTGNRVYLEDISVVSADQQHDAGIVVRNAAVLISSYHPERHDDGIRFEAPLGNGTVVDYRGHSSIVNDVHRESGAGTVAILGLGSSSGSNAVVNDEIPETIPTMRGIYVGRATSTHFEDGVLKPRTLEPTNGVRPPSGSADFPSYTFAGDTDTGFWRPAADVLAASVAGVERFRLVAGFLRMMGGTGLRLGAFDGPTITSGTADPNGSQTATPGSLHMRTDGTVYRKASGAGNTGWVAL